MVTITDVRVTGDLHDATVFYTVLGDEEERAASAAALESAKGVLRSEVGRQTGVRFTPDADLHPRRAARDRQAASTSCSPSPRAPTPRSRRPARAPAGRRPRSVPQAAGRRGRRRVRAPARPAAAGRLRLIRADRASAAAARSRATRRGRRRSRSHLVSSRSRDWHAAARRATSGTATRCRRRARPRRRLRRTSAPRQLVPAAATDVTSYDYRHLDDALAAGLAVTTGSTAPPTGRRSPRCAPTRDRRPHVQSFAQLALGIGDDLAPRSQRSARLRRPARDGTSGTAAQDVTLRATLVHRGHTYLVSDLGRARTPGCRPVPLACAPPPRPVAARSIAVDSYRRAHFDADWRPRSPDAGRPLREQLRAGAPPRRRR